MRNMKAFLIVLCISCAGFVQVKSQGIKFVAKYDSEILQLSNKKYQEKTGDSIEFSILKFYISDVELRNQGRLVYKLKKRHYLVDFENTQSTIIEAPEIAALNYDEIKFYIGIDSVTNYAGAMGGALDPTLGMYWTWQNGYINFKLEGKSPKCQTRNNQFEFHIGGYNAPYSTMQEIRIPTRKSKEITIALDLRKMLESIDLNTLHHIMSPCREAVQFSEQFPPIFNAEQ